MVIKNYCLQNIAVTSFRLSTECNYKTPVTPDILDTWIIFSPPPPLLWQAMTYGPGQQLGLRSDLSNSWSDPGGHVKKTVSYTGFWFAVKPLAHHIHLFIMPRSSFQCTCTRHPSKHDTLIQCWSNVGFWLCMLFSIQPWGWPNAGVMLCHRLRRWPNITPTLIATIIFRK